MVENTNVWEFSGINKKKICPELKQVVIRITGNLGNHLWQLAYAYHLRRHFAFDEILIDVRNCEGRMSQLELLKFCLPEYIYIMDEDTDYIDKFDQLRIAYEDFKKCVYKLENCIIDFTCIELYKRGYVFAEQSVPADWNLRSNTLFVSGFFQKIDNIRPSLKIFIDDCMTPNKKYLSEEYMQCLVELRKHEDAIAVSVRCGNDYKKLSWDFCKKNYFDAALQGTDGVVKFVFCDHYENARTILEEAEGFYWNSSRLSAFEQLNLMRYFKKYILSNSTFCYWGGLASYEDDVEVVFPDKWFPHLNTEEAEIIFGNYHIVPC